MTYWLLALISAWVLILAVGYISTWYGSQRGVSIWTVVSFGLVYVCCRLGMDFFTKRNDARFINWPFIRVAGLVAAAAAMIFALMLLQNRPKYRPEDRLVQRIDARAFAPLLAFTHVESGQHLVGLGARRSLVELQVTGGHVSVLRQFRADAPYGYAHVCSLRKHRLLAVASDVHVDLLSSEDFRRVSRHVVHDQACLTLLYSADDDILVTRSYREIRFWALPGMTLVAEVPIPEGLFPVSDLVAATRGCLGVYLHRQTLDSAVFSASATNAQLRLALPLSGREAPVSVARIAPSGAFVAAGCRRGDKRELRVYRLRDGARKFDRIDAAMLSELDTLMFSDSESILVAGSRKGSIVVWNLAEKNAVATLSGFVLSSPRYWFLDDSHLLVCDRETITIWDCSIAGGSM